MHVYIDILGSSGFAYLAKSVRDLNPLLSIVITLILLSLTSNSDFIIYCSIKIS